MNDEEIDKCLDKNVELAIAILDERDEQLLRLAKQVADLPPAPCDTKSIKEWAETLAADISKGRD